MVTTELLMSGADTSSAKFFINCLGKCCHSSSVNQWWQIPHDAYPPSAVVSPPPSNTPTKAEPPEAVAAFLVPRVRQVPSGNVNPITGSINSAYVRYLTKGKAFSQIISVRGIWLLLAGGMHACMGGVHACIPPVHELHAGPKTASYGNKLVLYL